MPRGTAKEFKKIKKNLGEARSEPQQPPLRVGGTGHSEHRWTSSPLPRGNPPLWPVESKPGNPHWVLRGWWRGAGEAQLDRVPALSGGAGHLTLKNLGCPVCKMGLHLPLGVIAQTRATS